VLESNAPLLFAFASLFEWQAVFPLGVAFFTTRYKISLGGFAAADDRNQMIHRQLFGGELSTAVMTDAARTFALPPLAGAQLAGPLPLAANLFFTDFD